jgi:serine/threonine protein kinase
METIGPYKVLNTLQGARRPMFVVAGKDGAKLLVKTAPLAGLNPEERERFEREAAICSTLDHPNLVRVVDSGQTPEFLYQVMPYLEGSDLGKVFGSGRQFTWDGKLSVMEGVCDGLAFAHARKLVHRDIKPANLFLENTGVVRILDFGMVRMDSSVLTRVGAAVGTLNYMAPEQVRGEPCSPASDVFAAGIVFHQLCTGAHPFAGSKKSLPEILSAILFDPPPAWNLADAPEGLEFVVRRALEKDPAKRWQSASELRQAVSLCRFTLENRPSSQAGAAPAFVAPPAVPMADSDKTVVIRRSTPPPVVAAPLPPEPPRVIPPPPTPALPTSDSRFCAACAYSNPKDAVLCAHCGVPLLAPQLPASEPVSNKLWIVAGIGVLVLVLGIVIGLVTR